MTRVLVVACGLAVLGACSEPREAPRAPAPGAVPAAPALQDFVPPFFSAAPGDARYLRRDARGVAEFSRDGMQLALRGAEKTIHWGLVGARAVEPRAEGPLEGQINFFIGAPSRWRAAVPTFSRLVYEGVYPGIDLVLESRKGGVEYTLEVAPGADLSPVRFRYEGAEVTARADGNGLELRTGSARLREEGLRCFQGTRAVGARYARVRRTAAGAEYGLQLDRFDASARLVIDPSLLWSSFVGGSAADDPTVVAVDGNHNLYVAGYTESSDFPIASPLDPALSGFRDAFVMKVHPSGSSVLWATYLGGSGADTALGMSVDPSGNVYVAGNTSSADFPATGGFDTTLTGLQDAFVTKIAASGSALLWSSYLGGTGEEAVAGVASNASGDAFVVGWTRSTDFPASGGFDATLGGVEDAFVTRISSAGSIDWSTYLGGPASGGDDGALSVAVDGSNNVYVGGFTYSSDFPSSGGFQTTPGGGGDPDGFVTKVNASGGSLAWSTFVGGLFDELGVTALAVDAAGNVFGIETTHSPNLPIAGGGFDPVYDGQDAYVFKIAASGSSLAWSTYLGGGGRETGDGLAIDGAGNVYVTGSTESTDFPVPDGFQQTFGGFRDAYVAKIAAGGTSLAWGTFLGGSTDDVATGMAIDDTGSVYVSGSTYSANFPVAGGFDRTPGVTLTTPDGFVAKIVPDSTPPIAGSVRDGLGADVDFQSSTTTMSASWSGFSDPESGITGYEWAIGTTAGGTNVQPFTPVGLSTLAGTTTLSLASGVTYYVTVRATNSEGLQVTATSDGVLVDSSPPLAGTVNDGPGADVDAWSSNTLSANWSGFSDAQSGIVRYDWAIGTTPGGTDVQAFTSVGLATSASATGLILSHNTVYYVAVRATNGAGLGVVTPSDGVRIDFTPPVMDGSVDDGLGGDIDAQSSTTTIDASWSGFRDPETNIAGYEWAIGTTPGGTEVQGFTAAGLTFTGGSGSASATGLSLASGTTYFTTVRAINFAGLDRLVSSDGVLVDATSPAPGAVNDGPGADLRYQSSTSSIAANWSGFSDPQSGITQYAWAIGSTPGGADVQPLTAVGSATSASLGGLTLVNGTTYYVTVQATNGAGLTVTAASNGVTVDATPPSGGSVLDGASAADIDFQVSLNRIDASWSGFADAESGVTGYEWAIGTTPGGTQVQAFTSVRMSTVASTSSLPLLNGAIYYVTVRATDGSGLTATATSDGVKVDATPPNAGVVNDGAGADVDAQSSTTIDANWSAFVDAESGVTGYEWAIGTSRGGTEVQGFTSVGAATSASATGLALVAGTTCYVTVRATNGAGGTSMATSDGVTVIAPEQPTASPASIDFGPVPVGGASGDQAVTVQNASAVTWSISSVASDNPEFVVDATGFPSSLAPGQSASLSLSFHPVAVGTRTGVLKLFFSGSTTPTAVSLSGTGVQDEPPGGCGCGATGGGAPALGLLALAFLLRRRATR